MLDNYVLLVILGMAVVSYIPRVLPFAVLRNRKMPAKFDLWLRYIPTSVFGSLIFYYIFYGENGLNLSLDNKSILASVPVLIVAIYTRSLPITTTAGLIIYAILMYAV